MYANFRARNRGLFLFVVSLSMPCAYADVTLEQKMSVEGTGLLKMINMNGHVVTTISGDRARTQSDLQMESRLMRMFGGGPSAQIVRLDEGKLYHLDLKGKTYTEMSLAEQKAEMERSIEQMREAQQSQQQSAAGVDEEACEWSEPTATVARPGEVETIAGTQAERVVVTASQSCKDPQTGQVCSFNLILDQWLAPEFAAGEEVTGYFRAYSEQLGLDVADSPGFVQRLESMFGSYRGIWGEIAGKMKEAEGYPLRSIVSLAVGGPQCEDAERAQATQTSPGLGEAVGGAFGGALGRFVGRRRDESATQAAPEPAAATDDALLPEGTVKLMSISSELISVKQEEAPAGSFDVPQNFRPAGR